MDLSGYKKDTPWKINKEQEKFFTQMEEELGQKISVIHGNGTRFERPEDLEGILVVDYGTISFDVPARKIDAISRRNGTQVALDHPYLLKSDNTTEHVFDFNGFPLCEIRLNTLWALVPLGNFGTEALMKEFWSDALRMCIDKAFFDKKDKERQDKVRKVFLDAMKASSQQELREAERQAEQQREALLAAGQQMVNAETSLLRTQKRMEIAEKIAQGDREVYEAEVESLMRHTQVKQIDFNEKNRMLEIYTQPLYIYSPSRTERAFLGEFCVKVNMASGNVVTLHNLTNPKSSKMHPHVESNGAACWGAIGSQIAKLAASCKIEGLVDLCIRYLETYNVQDGNARYARYWFTDKDTQTKRKEFDDQWMTEAEYKEAKKSQKEEVKATPKTELKETTTDTTTKVKETL